MKDRYCPFCGLKLISGGRHIYTCKHRNLSLNKENIKLTYIKYNFGESILEDICNDYQNLYSLPMLKEKYDIDNKSIEFLLSLNNIHIRNISESSEKISKAKYKETCIKKYGVDNVSKSDKIKLKKKATFLKHYGVDNIWKIKDYTLNIWNSFSDEKKNDIIKRRYQSINKNKTFGSNIELKVLEVLDNLKISYQRFYRISGYKHPYDIFLNNTKILIEVNGTFWHADPRKYKENDKILQPGKNRGILAKVIWEKDKKNIEHANKAGYKVITIWETEINNKSIEDLTKYIIDLLNNDNLCSINNCVI